MERPYRASPHAVQGEPPFTRRVTPAGGLVLSSAAMRRSLGLVAFALLATIPARADDTAPVTPPADTFCAARTGACLTPPYIGIVSAFPAEQAPLRAALEATETIVTPEHKFYVGILAGARVVLLRSGIGMVNAEAATRALVARFSLSAILFSGVAGSTANIGDVVVPEIWTDRTSATYPVAPALFAVAQTLAAPPVALEQCTPVPPDPPGGIVCMPQPLKIVFGGTGHTDDPFGGRALPCAPAAGPIFGCEGTLADTQPNAEDEETAVVARIAQEAGIPFLGFRGVSDGGGDPLNLGGFPSQFFAYYNISARNSASVTMAFLQAWVATDAGAESAAPRRRRGSSRTSIGAACQWTHAGDVACADAHGPTAVTASLTRACKLTAEGATDPGAAARAAKSWRKAATRMKTATARGLKAGCRQALADLLATREGATTGGALRLPR
jgi:nucleoside phosphorylase